MIRYPSSQLGEMSLEEHSQCECRCQPGPTSELPETRLGGVLGVVVHHSGGGQVSKTGTGLGLGSGVRAGCLALLILFLFLVSVCPSYFSDQKRERVL